jgi:hypothetical protein
LANGIIGFGGSRKNAAAAVAVAVAAAAAMAAEAMMIIAKYDLDWTLIARFLHQ